jgi:NAD(P)-dependent dehydrogenase (short-subunit alcohol dehydrogenase family)
MKLAVITGGHQGVGLGIAEALQEAGFALALVGQAPPRHPQVTAALGHLPGAHYFQHDLKEVEKVARLVADIETACGPISILVSNAGVPSKIAGDMLEIAPANFDFVLNINLRGSFFLAQEVARRMLAAKTTDYRALIFVTSVSAGMVSVDRAEYCISKAAASMAVEAFAVRLAPEGIGVFELRPGLIETEMSDEIRAKHEARIASGLVPAGRWGQPADIGRVVVPMATGAMDFATGAIVPVDGGLSIPRR